MSGIFFLETGRDRFTTTLLRLHGVRGVHVHFAWLGLEFEISVALGGSIFSVPRLELVDLQTLAEITLI